MLARTNTRRESRCEAQSVEKLRSGSTPVPPSMLSGWSNTKRPSPRQFSSSANTERFSAEAHHLLSVPSLREDDSRARQAEAGNRLLERELNTRVCHCPAGTGELARKLDMISAQR